MGRAPCCDKGKVKKGPWSPEEDAKLKDYIQNNGTGGNWIALPHKVGLKRCGKSCRLRWLNYLRPNIKHGEFSDDEDRIIFTLYATIGSRWSIIAAQLPGRTDNDIKNYWNTKLKKKLFSTTISPSPLLLPPPPPPPPPSSSSSSSSFLHYSTTSSSSSSLPLLHSQTSSSSSLYNNNDNNDNAFLDLTNHHAAAADHTSSPAFLIDDQKFFNNYGCFSDDYYYSTTIEDLITINTNTNNENLIHQIKTETETETEEKVWCNDHTVFKLSSLFHN